MTNKELQAENALLKHKLGRLLGAEQEWELVQPGEYARLKAENERLRKAGDAVCESPYLLENDPAVIAWRAAKEGKQS